MAMTKKPASSKSKLLGLNSSRKKLNSSKTVDEVTYYSLADVEAIAASILSEVSADPTVGITIEASDTGVVLNCITENGDEYTVDVDLESEDGMDAADAAAEELDMDVDVDVDSSRRRMNSSKKASRRRMNSSRKISRRRMNSSRKKLNSGKRYFAVPVTDHSLMAKIEDDDVTDAEIMDAMEAKGYEIDGDAMKSYSPDKFCTLTWTDDELGGYLEG